MRLAGAIEEDYINLLLSRKQRRLLNSAAAPALAKFFIILHPLPYNYQLASFHNRERTVICTRIGVKKY